MQGPTSTPTMMPTSTPLAVFDPSSVVSSLGTTEFWTALWVALLAGAIGGVVYELLALHGNVELPHRPSADEFPEALPHAHSRNVFDLGILARVIVGAVAAIAALLVLNPTTGFALVATSLIAGSAGTSILRALQDRITAALAVGEVNQARENGAKTEEVIQAIEAKVAELEAALAAALAAAQGNADPSGRVPGALSMAAAPRLSSLDEIHSLLGEAKGLARGISRR